MFYYELYKELAASVLGGLLVVYALHIGVGHRQLPIVWEHWSAKKNLEIRKMTDYFSHAQLNDLETAKAERFFFLLISLFKST